MIMRSNVKATIATKALCRYVFFKWLLLVLLTLNPNQNFLLACEAFSWISTTSTTVPPPRHRSSFQQRGTSKKHHHRQQQYQHRNPTLLEVSVGSSDRRHAFGTTCRQQSQISMVGCRPATATTRLLATPSSIKSTASYFGAGNNITTIIVNGETTTTTTGPSQQQQDESGTQRLTSSSSTLTIPGGATKRLSFPLVLWKFTRPHTLIGSALAIPALHALAAPSYAALWSSRTWRSCLVAMIPALLMNLYITGLNQITDVDIDKINKPYLPIVAGQLSIPSAKIIVTIALLSSLSIGAFWPVPYATQGLNVALWGSALLGTMYSLPPFRLKRFPFLAAFCIVAVRGTIINAGFFAHARAAAFLAADAATAATTSPSILRYLVHDPKCILSSLYFGIFGIVIALMKDVPDVRGDRLRRVLTFSVRLGPGRVFGMGRRLLTGLLWGVGAAFFLGAMRAATTTTTTVLASSTTTGAAVVAAVGRSIVAIASVWAGWDVQQRGRQVQVRDSQQVYDYYMHLWKIFYASYLLLPLAR